VSKKAYDTYKAIHKFPTYFDYIANFMLKIWDIVVFRIGNLSEK